MRIQYTAARKAFEYLESLAELNDQVGLDSERENLMQEPTKAKAAEMYVSGIGLWFSEHGDDEDLLTPKAKQIRRRYVGPFGA